jgi:hypothetical protein
MKTPGRICSGCWPKWAVSVDAEWFYISVELVKVPFGRKHTNCGVVMV